jgi:hypothetical protein
MTVEELQIKLEKIISDLTSSGFASIDPRILDKLDKLAVSAIKLDMKEGKRLIDNLSGAMKAIQEGKSRPESGDVRLTALDFYLRKISEKGHIEDID